MRNVVCPHCAARMRTKPGRRRLICPACKAKFHLDKPAAASAERPSNPFLWRAELVSALLGLASLAGLLTTQAFVLRPIGQSFPGHRSVVLPAPIDSDEADTVQPRPDCAAVWPSGSPVYQRYDSVTEPCAVKPPLSAYVPAGQATEVVF